MLKGRAAIAAAIVVGMAAGASITDPASAHAELVSSAPPAGAQLRPGSRIVLHFDDPVVPAESALSLVRAHVRSNLGPLTHASADIRTLSALVPAGQPGGPAQLDWTALSDDGHVTDGSVPFVVAPVAAATVSVLTATGTAAHQRASTVLPHGGEAGIRTLSAGLAVSRLIVYLALCLLCGGLAFLALAWPAAAEIRRARSILWGGLTAGLVSSAAAVVLEAAYVQRSAGGQGLSLPALASFLTSPIGRLWAARALLFALATPVVYALSAQGERAARSPAWRIGAAAVGIALLRTPGLLGHSAEARRGALGTAADIVHMSGVAVWIGGLVFLALVLLPRRDPDELASVLPRFSTLALVSVAAVVLGGAFMAWQLVGSVSSATSTHYGHVLLLKLAAVSGVLLAASRSKAWVARRLDHAVVLGGDRMTLRPLVLSVGTEVALAVAALAVASVLVNTPPGR